MKCPHCGNELTALEITQMLEDNLEAFVNEDSNTPAVECLNALGSAYEERQFQWWVNWDGILPYIKALEAEGNG